MWYLIFKVLLLFAAVGSGLLIVLTLPHHPVYGNGWDGQQFVPTKHA